MKKTLAVLIVSAPLLGAPCMAAEQAPAPAAPIGAATVGVLTGTVKSFTPANGQSKAVMMIADETGKNILFNPVTATDKSGKAVALDQISVGTKVKVTTTADGNSSVEIES